jgi:Fe-S oxidoreductase
MIDAGCCGMAGTFGYEAEHYDLSMKVGELKLLPYLRQYAVTDEPQVVVSTGAACRMQIHQGVSAEPIHSIQLVEKFLFDEASDVKE